MAYFGFCARLSDGREVRESDCVWDAVPQGIKRLSIVEVVDDGSAWRERAALEAAPGRQFFFYNEVVALRGGMGILSAKGIGYVEDGRVTELRLDFMPGRAASMLRLALQPFVNTADRLTRKRWFKFIASRPWFTQRLEAATEALRLTEREDRLSWRTYPASQLKLSEAALRKAA